MQAKQKLPIVETFHSIQGEGFWTGINAFFIRLAGCDVGCKWCDQKESWSSKYPLRDVRSLADEARSANPAIVVITGGEPLMHDLSDLTAELKRSGLKVNLETSGTHPLTGRFDWVTLSPKRHKEPLQGVWSIANELKVVIQSEQDLQFADECSRKVSEWCWKFLQPEAGTKNGKAIVFDYVLKNPRWQISLQTHKILEVA